MPPSAFLAGFAPGFLDAQSSLLNNQYRQLQMRQVLQQMAQQQREQQANAALAAGLRAGYGSMFAPLQPPPASAAPPAPSYAPNQIASSPLPPPGTGTVDGTTPPPGQGADGYSLPSVPSYGAAPFGTAGASGAGGFAQAPGGGFGTGLAAPGGFNAGYQTLLGLGVSPQVAQGATAYMARNESGSDPYALNPQSGAFGRAQWLGPRKAALTSEFGAQPTDPQQARFMRRELTGPESGTLASLRSASTGKQGYDIWGSQFERPGQAALARAGVTSLAGPARPIAADAIANASPDSVSASNDLAGMMRRQFEAEQLTLRTAFDAIDKTDYPDDVKGLAMTQLMKVMPTADRQSFSQLLLTAKLMEQQQKPANEPLGGPVKTPQGWVQPMRSGPPRPLGGEPVGAEGREETGWQVVTDQDGTQYRYNPRTTEATTLAGQPYTPKGAATRVGTQQPAPSGQQVDFWANVVFNGGALPPGLGRSGAFTQAVAKRIADLHGGDPSQYVANISTVKSNQAALTSMTKMAASASSFEETAIRNFDQALKLSKDAIPTDWGPWLNQFIETGETQAGNTDVPPYVAAMLTAANEYAKIMSGSTGAQGSTVDSRREAAQLFSPYLNSGQIDRVVAVAKADMANRMDSLNSEIDNIKGQIRSPGSRAPQGQPGGGAAAGGADVPTLNREQFNQAIKSGRLKPGDAFRKPNDPQTYYVPEMPQ